MISPYLIDMMILLTAAVIAVPICKIIRLGTVPGFLLAGLMVGPSGLGLINNIEEISHLAEIGVVLLLFVIGIELKPSHLWRMRKMVFGLGLLQVMLTGALLALAAYMLFGASLRESLLLGPVLALSSTAFVLQLLAEQGMLQSTYGRASFSILLFQDLAVVPLLALVPLLAMPEISISANTGITLLKGFGLLAITLIIGHYGLRFAFRHVALSENSEIFTAFALLLVLGFALITEHIGMSMAMGAFLAGLLISDSPYKHEVMAEVQPFRGLLLGLFFMSMGMMLNLELLLASPLLSFALVLGLMLAKTGVLFAIASGFGLSRNHSLASALVLAQSGEFALVLFSLAFHAQVLSAQLFQTLLLMVLLSMLLTPLLARLAFRIATQTPAMQDDEHANILSESAPIVIAGYGRVGHRIGEILTMAGQLYVALDANVALVEHERANGHPVFYGDVRKPKLLASAGAANANVIIITTSDPETTLQVATSLRKLYPKTALYVRGKSLAHCQALRSMGVGVVSETVEASLELARMVMHDLGLQEQEREAYLQSYRNNYLARINNVSEVDIVKPATKHGNN